MKKKLQIGYSTTRKMFTLCGDFIEDDRARECWDSGEYDWSQGAFQEMSRRVMA
jgi:hypothetical protein